MAPISTPPCRFVKPPPRSSDKRSREHDLLLVVTGKLPGLFRALISQADKPGAVIRRLKAEGAAILYVSHRMGEILQICDDVTVLRNGRHVKTTAVAETSREEIILDMPGRDIDHGYPRRESKIGDTVVCRSSGVATRRLTGIEFDFREG